MKRSFSMSLLLFTHIKQICDMHVCDTAMLCINEFYQNTPKVGHPHPHEMIISKRQNDYFVAPDILLTFTCGHFVDRK